MLLAYCCSGSTSVAKLVRTNEITGSILHLGQVVSGTAQENEFKKADGEQLQLRLFCLPFQSSEQ